MGHDLDELASYFKPKAQALITACASAGVAVRVVSTGRTPEEQQQKLAQGVSWTTNSKHLPQPPEMLSEAIDIVPLTVLKTNKKDWDPSNPAWKQIGEIGKILGLRWGGDWVHLNNGFGDPSHFEYIHPPTEV